MNIRRNHHGELFLIVEDGYEGREKKRRKDAIDITEYNLRMETYTKRLALWTERLTYAGWAAALGTFCLFLWEMRHFLKVVFFS